MYLGWNFCEKISRSNEIETAETDFSLPSNNAICLIIESLMMTAEGEKLNDAPEEFGAESVQFKAQHKRATFASDVCSLLFAFLQHFIIWLFPECRGIPANTPPARAKIRKSDVSHLFIYRFTILNKPKFCQE